VRGDTVEVRRVFAELWAARRTFDAADVALETAYPEAWTLLTIGDTGAAVASLDAALGSLPKREHDLLVDVAAAGALVRAMALRAELAANRTDRVTAVRWARAVAVLWSDADSFLQPVARRMAAMARVVE
jgi:hypothetical protein